MTPLEFNGWRSYFRRHPPLGQLLPVQMAILLAKLDAMFSGQFDPAMYLPGATEKQKKVVKKQAEKTVTNPRKQELQLLNHKRAAKRAVERMMAEQAKKDDAT